MARHLATYNDYLNWLSDPEADEEPFTVSRELLKTLIDNKLVSNTDILQLSARLA